jgi:3-phytase
MRRSLARFRAANALLALTCLSTSAIGETSGDRRVVLSNPAAVDQDDLCFWRDAATPERSLVIASDKSAGRLFVYDLAGALRQELTVPKPGNIDIRQGVTLGNRELDIVAVNQRAEGTCLRLFEVDAATGQLQSLGDAIPTPPNYGGCLFYDREVRRLYFICTAEDGLCHQFEILFDAEGNLTGREVRKWQIGKCEGAVADDERGLLFITEETRGIWKLGARPDDATPGELIALVGEQGLTGDLEGIAIGPAPDRWLIASDQGRSKYVVFESTGEHRLLGELAIDAVGETDGLDVIGADLGEKFPDGLFGCHNGAVKPCPVVLTLWSEAKGLLRRVE